MSIVSLRDIEAHEEIFVNYNYRVWQAPAWYQEQWIHHKRDVENVSEETLLEITRRISRQYGIYIPMYTPKKTSSRYSPCGSCNTHVSVTDTAISCDTCDVWYHGQCTEIGLQSMCENTEAYNGWRCPNCNVMR